MDSREEGGLDGELLPGQSGFDQALAQGQYEFARSRFVRTVTGDGVARIVERAAQQRTKLYSDIDNLRVLVRARHEAAVERARNYGTVLPHRVGKNWIQPPGQLEKVGAFHGSDRLYKLAERATKDYVEIRDLLVKKRDQLITMEQDLRNQLDRREEALIRQMESPRGLEIALQRDPLLASAYKKLKALQGELKESKVDGLGDL